MLPSRAGGARLSHSPAMNACHRRCQVLLLKRPGLITGEVSQACQVMYESCDIGPTACSPRSLARFILMHQGGAKI